MQRTQRLLQLLDPRRSLRARFALVLGVSGAVFAIGAAFLVERYQRAQLETRVGQALQREANLVGHALGSSLQDRLLLIRQVAAQPVLSTGVMEPGEWRLSLESVRANQPELAWLAVVNLEGRGQVATQALLEGEVLADEPWFRAGLRGPWLGGRHPAGRLTGPFGLTQGSLVPYFLDMAVPLIDYQGRTFGVLVAQFDWDWVQAQHDAVASRASLGDGVDTLLLGEHAEVQIGPAPLVGKPLALPDAPQWLAEPRPTVRLWPDGTRYLSAVVRIAVADTGRELLLVARQEERIAFGAAERLRGRLLQGGLLATLLFVAVSVWLAGRVVRPIRELSAAADRLRHGQSLAIQAPPEGGGDELRTLSATLREMDESVREQIAERQRESEHYRALFEGSPDAHFVVVDDRIQHANTTCLALFGADSVEQLIERGVWQLMHPDDHGQLRTRRQALRDGAQRLDLVQERIVKLDGEVVEVETSGLVFSSAGRPALHMVMRDVTARNQAARALAHSEERFRLAMQGTAAGLWDWDIPAHQVFYTDTWTQLLGETCDSLPRSVAAWGPRVAADDRERVMGQMRALAEGQCELLDTELRLAHRDGHEVVLLTRAFLTRDANGRPARVIGTVLDVTERHQAREALSLLNAELESRVARRTAALQQANEELDSFSYAVSHDLQAPLRSMLQLSQALQADHAAALAPRARQYLDFIDQSARRMTELVEGLLALSRNGRERLHAIDVPISRLAERIATELREAEPGRWVEVEIAPDLHAWGDVRLIDVVLRNLLGNAWKYSAKNPQARIQVVAEDDADGRRWICINDNGAGFDMAHASQLFKPFQRLHRSDQFPGIGIGLATVQRIVQRHGGEITASAVPGQGASFRFTLPAAPITPT